MAAVSAKRSMTNSQSLDFLSMWLGRSVDGAFYCNGIAKSWVRISFKPEFFSGCFSTAQVESTLRGSQISLLLCIVHMLNCGTAAVMKVFTAFFLCLWVR